MSNPVLGPEGVVQRYQTHRTQLMTLYVTRQRQVFETSADLQLSDIELINASVELVGEPGIGNTGVVSGGYDVAGASAKEDNRMYNSTFNMLHAVNDAGTTSTVYNEALENRILTKTHLHHGHVNVFIEGMHEPHQFRRDAFHAGNQLSLTIPTDLGLAQARLSNQTWPPTPILVEQVKLEQRLRVNTQFLGTWPEPKRLARFVEDWADSTAVKASVTTRNSDGTVRYFVNDDEGQASTQECQVPANCINVMKLTFKVMPRTTL